MYIEDKFGIRFGDLEALELESLYDLIVLTHQYYSEKRNKQLLEHFRMEKEVRVNSRREGERRRRSGLGDQSQNERGRRGRRRRSR